MNKEKILALSRNSNEDEGVDHINRRADAIGLYAVCILSLLLTFYKSQKNLPVGDILSLLFVFISVGMYARFSESKERSTLLFGLLCSAIALSLIIFFIIGTW